MKKRHRFIIPGPLMAGPLVLKDRETVHQIAAVLRLKEGEEVILLDGSGQEANAKLVSVSKTDVRFEVAKPERNAAEPSRRVTLYCAVLKRENFELAAQKAIEAGVFRIVPIRTERTVKLDVKRERLEKIIREAAEQSGRGIVPQLSDVMEFDEALKDADDLNAKYFFDLDDAHAFSPDAHAESVALFIGPEGGWTTDEATAAKEAGCKIAHLGKLVLRGETAAIIAVHRAVYGA